MKSLLEVSPEESRLVILNCIPESGGWSPIQYMIGLASELLQATVLPDQPGEPSMLTKMSALLKRRTKDRHAGESCLMICTGPGDILRALELGGWRTRFRFLAAWIIDSFWLDHIPSSVRMSRLFDHFFVTSLDDVEEWKKLTGTPVSWLPWGSDVLRFRGRGSTRPWDITRVGRQPPEWDDDATCSEAAQSLGINYRGRPSGDGLSAVENHHNLMEVYSGSKYVLAFSSSVNPERYTHPTREYLTGRWVDALACGATVAGMAPKCSDARELLWPGATLDFRSTRRQDGLAILAEALKVWSPDLAARNQSIAREKLDWRWRFKQIADTFEIMAPPLMAELDALGEATGRPAREPSGASTAPVRA